jgi:hypothetical protein
MLNNPNLNLNSVLFNISYSNIEYIEELLVNYNIKFKDFDDFFIKKNRNKDFLALKESLLYKKFICNSEDFVLNMVNYNNNNVDFKAYYNTIIKKVNFYNLIYKINQLNL